MDISLPLRIGFPCSISAANSTKGIVHQASDDAREATKRPKATLAEFRKPEEHNGLRHVVYWSLADSVPSDLFAYGREAMFCFVNRRYIASITMSSATVELILNRDRRMRTGQPGWWPLSAKLLRRAEKMGLPVQYLLSPGETFKTDKSARFVVLRNQLAHGNIESVIEFKAGGATDYNADAIESRII